MINEDLEPRFIDKWWPLFFIFAYLLVLFGGLVLATDKTVAVDDCAQIVASCYTVEKQETLGTIDKYETKATKPSLGNYRSFSYEVISWGSVTTDLESFAATAAETLTDPRGWAQAGVNFSRVTDGGDFSLVLSSPSQVAAASPGCSADWSCRVGRYVIINEDRWLGATTSWNNDGGSLRDYQHMVVNHETGHFLGLGHPAYSCSSATVPAPVMLQQSINLQGCAHNPWPLLSEIEALQ